MDYYDACRVEGKTEMADLVRRIYRNTKTGQLCIVNILAIRRGYIQIKKVNEQGHVIGKKWYWVADNQIEYSHDQLVTGGVAN